MGITPTFHSVAPNPLESEPQYLGRRIFGLRFVIHNASDRQAVNALRHPEQFASMLYIFQREKRSFITKLFVPQIDLLRAKRGDLAWPLGRDEKGKTRLLSWRPVRL